MKCLDHAHPNIVWHAILDNRYDIQVQRTDTASAVLGIFDRDSDNALIYEEKVPLSYGAKFGPDVDDVLTWQTSVEKVIDNLS